MKKKQKKTFFIILAFLLIIISVTSSCILAGGYFYFTSKNRIYEINRETKLNNRTFIEASCQIAELDYKRKNYRNLQKFFNKQLNMHTDVIEAFFISTDGSILASSKPKLAKELQYSIMNDQFRYNSDLLLRSQIESKKNSVIFTDYFLPDYNSPFLEKDLIFLKKHIYQKIDINSWLTNKKVYQGKKLVGTINIITSKQKIYRVLHKNYYIAKKLFYILLASSLGCSLILFLIFYLRKNKNSNEFDKKIIKKEKDTKETTEHRVIRDAIPKEK